MDLAHLRSVLRPHIVGLKDSTTHSEIPMMCEKLGLPDPRPEGSKADRIRVSFDGLTDSDLPRVAERFLELHPPAKRLRNEIQDILWADSSIKIPKRCRHEIACALESTELYLNAAEFDRLLDAVWIMDEGLLDVHFGGRDNSLSAQVRRHVHQNPGDWSSEQLFEKLGAFDASDRRFALFVEGLASPDVRPDESSQRQFVDVVNGPLGGFGMELRESGTEGGYPTFTIASKHLDASGRPKNLIFASQVKPDLRFRDAVNNDIEVVTNADKVLIYDRPIGRGGLLWRDLQEWWSVANGIPNDEDAKHTLFRRLRVALPESSPPQLLLFDAFYRAFGASTPNLPALLPEVWLHWDPKTVRERGPRALERFRMDFLLLLHDGIRVVVEVDGKQHYATEKGEADPRRYAKMVSADRELALAGYHVFRFGAAELQSADDFEAVKLFFRNLFKRFSVSPA
jgi:hypothetical protein